MRRLHRYDVNMTSCTCWVRALLNRNFPDRIIELEGGVIGLERGVIDLERGRNTLLK